MFHIAVQEGQIGLLEVVRALGDYLTSTEDEVRVRGRDLHQRTRSFPELIHLLSLGITLLSNVLDKAPAARINRQGSMCLLSPGRSRPQGKTDPGFQSRTAQVLTSFYCDKLEDHECVPSTLKGLSVLAKLPTFGAGEASQVFGA